MDLVCLWFPNETHIRTKQNPTKKNIEKKFDVWFASIGK